jgi:hypothetical protein
MTATQMAHASGTGMRRSLSSEWKADDTAARASDVFSFLDIIRLLDIGIEPANYLSYRFRIKTLSHFTIRITLTCNMESPISIHESMMFPLVNEKFRLLKRDFQAKSAKKMQDSD